MLSRRRFIQMGATLGAGVLLPLEMAEKVFAFNLLGQQLPLNPAVLPKFVDRLPIPNLMPGAPAGSGVDYEVQARPNKTVVSSGMAAAVAPNGFTYTGTNVWSYRPTAAGFTPNLPVGTAVGYGAPLATYLGPTFVANKGTGMTVKWINNLKDGAGNPIPHPLAVDPSLHWANPLNQDPATLPGVTVGTNPATGLVGPIYPTAAGKKGASTFDYTLTTVPIVPHVHGGEQISFADGGPFQWFTPDGKYGPTYATYDPGTGSWSGTPASAGANYSIYKYDNNQQGALIWYHDHAMGLTRLNVYMGLAGGYVLKDASREATITAGGIPSIFSGAVDAYGQPFDIPLVIQDRMFDISGQLYFPAVSNNPTVNPFWAPEFFGDTILVNGVVWPYLRVEPKPYRLRLLNGSNARFYTLNLSGGSGKGAAGGFFQIATDGGYLGAAAPLTTLTIAPGERCEIVVDFSQFAGKTVTLNNTAKAPFPAGAPTDKNTGQIIQFRVDPTPAGVVPVAWAPPATVNAQLSTYAATGTPTLLSTPAPASPAPARTRLLTLNEIMGPGGPLLVVVNHTYFPHEMPGGSVMSPLTETPSNNTAEYWMIVNMTADAHPIHLHLIDFQLVQRQAYDAKGYTGAWTAAFPGGIAPMQPFGPPLALVADPMNPGMFALDVAKYNTALPGVLGPGGTPVIGGNPDVTPFLKGAAVLPPVNERGWKDTVQMFPGEVTTIVARWATNDTNAMAPFSFDPTAGPGYVWHCHIIDHEDNEMMRPYKVI